MSENKNTTYENANTVTSNKIEWIAKEPVPHFRYSGKEYFMLNNMIEVVIDGVLYRVKSIYSGSTLLGDVLDSLTMEQINRTVA